MPFKFQELLPENDNLASVRSCDTHIDIPSHILGAFFFFFISENHFSFFHVPVSLADSSRSLINVEIGMWNPVMDHSALLVSSCSLSCSP